MAKSSQIACGTFSMQFDRVQIAAAECRVGGGGTRGGYYQHRLEWRSWLAGRRFAQGLSQRPNAVTNSNFLTNGVLAYSRRNFVFVHSIPLSYPDPHLQGLLHSTRQIRSGGQTRKSRALEHEAEPCTAPAPGVRRKCDRRAISRCSELGSVVCSLSSSPSFHGCGTACTAARVS
jgi:hypothetical protein